jgi:hypothetical protein
MDMKESLVSEASGGRTTHSSELTDAEAQALIGKLRAKEEKPYDECDRYRKRLIAMSYGIQEDATFVKAWCEKYGVFNEKKKFNAYQKKELIGLIEKFKKVVAARMEQAKKL